MRYSLGLDIGTTTVLLGACDKNGRVYNLIKTLNRQYPDYGTDSIKRIQNGLNKTSAEILQVKAVETVNFLLDKYAKEIGIEPDDVDEIAIAGNTAMEMAFCGYPLISLSKPPYRPLSEIYFPDNTDLIPGFSFKNKKLFIFPVLDGFVGGDAVASLYFLDAALRDKPFFIADFGTNVEIAVGFRSKIFTASAPAGPAFEGGNIRYGMLASPGAISGLSLNKGIFKLDVMGGGVPSGICGSGIMKLIYLLLNDGIIDKNGRILPPEVIESESFHVARKKEDENEVVLYMDGKKEIIFSQEDVRQFQFAKSAVKTASQILLDKFKISGYEDFDVYISGTFGSNISPEIIDAIDIFPFKGKKLNFIEDSVVSACLKYVCEAESERSGKIKKIMDISKNFPLSGSKLFENLFIKNVSFST